MDCLGQRAAARRGTGQDSGSPTGDDEQGEADPPQGADSGSADPGQAPGAAQPLETTGCNSTGRLAGWLVWPLALLLAALPARRRTPARHRA